MVQIVDKSLYGFGYREINQQLARDNGELRQQLSAAYQERLRQREELHRRDVQIAELRSQINELEHIRAKYDAIRNIVTDNTTSNMIRPVEPARRQTTSIQALSESRELSASPSPSSSPLRLPSATFENNDGEEEENSAISEGDSTFDVDHSRRMSENVLEAISEVEEEEEEGVDKEADEEVNKEADEEVNKEKTSDSLEPADVTSVPPIDKQERTIRTPSIWNCFDSIDSNSTPHQQSKRLKSSGSFNSNSGLRQSNNGAPSSPILPVSNLNLDMFQSTPVLSKQSLSGPKLNDQENCADDVIAGKPPKKGGAKKQVRRAVQFTTPRYNLRNRAKV